jgi:hypothetical protein
MEGFYNTGILNTCPLVIGEALSQTEDTGDAEQSSYITTKRPPS